jgi:hypothetical protein
MTVIEQRDPGDENTPEMVSACAYCAATETRSVALGDDDIVSQCVGVRGHRRRARHGASRMRELAGIVVTSCLLLVLASLAAWVALNAEYVVGKLRKVLEKF